MKGWSSLPDAQGNSQISRGEEWPLWGTSNPSRTSRERCSRQRTHDSKLADLHGQQTTITSQKRKKKKKRKSRALMTSVRRSARGGESNPPRARQARRTTLCPPRVISMVPARRDQGTQGMPGTSGRGSGGNDSSGADMAEGRALTLEGLGGWSAELCRQELPSVLPRLLISFHPEEWDAGLAQGVALSALCLAPSTPVCAGAAAMGWRCWDRIGASYYCRLGAG